MIDRTRYMTAAEVATLLASVDRHARAIGGAEACRDARRTQMLIRTALGTGLRVSELARLTAADLDPELCTLAVTRSKKRGKGGRDALVISADLAGRLAAWGRETGGPFWPGRHKPLGIRSLQVLWAQAVQDAGLPDRYSGIHTARHTYATQMYAKTLNIKAVQQALGHASSDVTSNMYVGWGYDDQRAAVEKIWKNVEEGLTPEPMNSTVLAEA